jgi:tetratricopeptide (TPR) repeat protein
MNADRPGASGQPSGVAPARRRHYHASIGFYQFSAWAGTMDQDLQASPVAASAGNRTKIFISYSRKDIAFAQMLVGRLAERGFDAFLDKTDIAPGEPWKDRLAGLIAAADTVVFAISPDSVVSGICAWELEESVRLGKRIIPVVTRRVPDADAPPSLARLNWVFFTETDDQNTAGEMLEAALRTDLAWVREHTRLAELARRWDHQGRSNGATLRGADLEAAERWLDRRPADANAPTDLHQDFIRASRRAATARQRYWIGGSLAVAVMAIALAAFAEVSRRDADAQRVVAQTQRTAAEQARNEAQAQRDRAERTLTLATGTANGLVFDLAQKFRNVLGVPAATIKDILDRARLLQDQLLGSGEANPELSRSQAAALEETSRTLLTLGDTQGAFAAGKKAQEIFQALLAQQPDSRSFQDDLSVSYDDMGNVAVKQGHLPEALASYQAGLAIRERLAKSDPGNAKWQRGLSVSYDKIANVQMAQGYLPEALSSHQAGLAIDERLTKSDPGNAEWQHDLSISYDSIATVQMRRGHLPEALASAQAGLAIRERLAKSDPGNAGWQHDLSLSYSKVGEVQIAQAHPLEALSSYQASLAIEERLVKSDPGNVDWQRDLSVSYQRAGNMQLAQGHQPEALTAYQASLAIADRLAKSDPGNAGWQRDVSISYNKIGDMQVAQHHLPEALASYQASLAIQQQLAKSDPGNALWQRDLAFSSDHIGGVQVAQGHLPEALASYRAGLAVRERLAKSDPGVAD